MFVVSKPCLLEGLDPWSRGTISEGVCDCSRSFHPDLEYHGPNLFRHSRQQSVSLFLLLMNGNGMLRMNSGGRREKAESMLFQVHRAEV